MLSCLNILYIDLPLGLDMFFCSGDPLWSSGRKDRFCTLKSPCVKPLRQEKSKRSGAQSYAVASLTTLYTNKTVIVKSAVVKT